VSFLLTRGFFKHFLQNRKHGEVAWTAGCLLAPDDISKSSHQNSHTRRGSANEEVEIDGGHRRALQSGGRSAPPQSVTLQQLGNARE
jgi:hypothetical protein